MPIQAIRTKKKITRKGRGGERGAEKMFKGKEKIGKQKNEGRGGRKGEKEWRKRK